VLAGAAPFAAALQSSHRENLTFIACGSRTRSGPELIGSPAMSQLLVELRARYRVILVDSPPLAAGVEPYILGTLTGNLLLVMRLGQTDRDLAEGKLDALDRLPVRVLGAVLNGVRSAEIYRRYAYSMEGYELRDEETTWAEQKILRERL
jgi:Mrp family chromosome partitioning ATPase